MAKITEQEITSILQQSLDLVMIFDPADLTLLFVNEHGANWLGYDNQELLEKLPIEFMPEMSAAELENILENLRLLEPGQGASVVTPVTRCLGNTHDFEFRMSLIVLGQREFVLASGRDISERVAATDQVHNLLASAQIESRQDNLTQLYQRDDFLEIFQDLVQQVRPGDDFRLALLVIDMKNLHNLNRRFGQSIGDRVLRSMGGLLRHVTSREDICARFSGRKLCVLMPNKGQNDGLTLAEIIHRALSKVKYVEHPTLEIHTSIAVAEIPQPDNPEMLMDKAISQLRELKNVDKPHDVHRLGLLVL